MTSACFLHNFFYILVYTYVYVYTEGWKLWSNRGPMCTLENFQWCAEPYFVDAAIIIVRCLPLIPRRDKLKSLLSWSVLYGGLVWCWRLNAQFSIRSRFLASIISMCSLHVILLSKIIRRYFTWLTKGIFHPFNVRWASGGWLPLSLCPRYIIPLHGPRRKHRFQ
jgi:hypothetical protein